MTKEILYLIQEKCWHILNLLVGGKYLELQEISGGVRLSSDAIKRAVSDYGRDICLPPSEEEMEINIVEINGSIPPRLSVDVYLWTIQEGRSDLTLQLTFVELSGDLKVEIDDLHVL